MFRRIEVIHITRSRACLRYSHKPTTGSEDVMFYFYIMMVFWYFYNDRVRVLYIRVCIRDSSFIPTKRKSRYDKNKQWRTYQ